MGDVQHALCITEIPFPFPYQQVLTVLLAAVTFFISISCGLFAEHPMIAALGGFTVPFAYWCINYTAQELEMPFGDDPNDLPLFPLQETFNASLKVLLYQEASKTPEFVYDKSSKLMV